MNVTDEISDLLTRIRNAQVAKHPIITVPASRIKQAICELLVHEGYLSHVERTEDSKQGLLQVGLKYDSEKEALIKGLERVSKPGRKVYCGVRDIPRVRQGLGIAILSTSLGVLTDSQAREKNAGGEYLCKVW